MEKTITSVYYRFQRSFLRRAHSQSLFTVEILPGIMAEFGEPKSKLGSKRYHLTQLQIRKDQYSEDVADAFWRRFHVCYINRSTLGRKVPRLFKVKGRPEVLVKGGYVIICEPNLSMRKSFVFQNSYEYWVERFGHAESLASDSPYAQSAIKELLNKISSKPTLLKNIPKNDSRVFEQLVAEVFRGFGFEVTLTKRTRDGGKDVIALQRYEGQILQKLLIECKHWEDKVSVEAVRSLLGVAISEEELPTGVILATSSTFTPDAKKIKVNSAIEIDLHLKDYEDILLWIGDYDAMRFTPQEIARYVADKSE